MEILFLLFRVDLMEFFFLFILFDFSAYILQANIADSSVASLPGCRRQRCRNDNKRDGSFEFRCRQTGTDM